MKRGFGEPDGEVRSDVHFVAQVIDDLLDSGLDYFYGATEARAGVAIQHRVAAESLSARLEERVLFRVKANALI